METLTFTPEEERQLAEMPPEVAGIYRRWLDCVNTPPQAACVRCGHQFGEDERRWPDEEGKDYCSECERHRPTISLVWPLFHLLWSKAVGQPDYDKQEWLRLEALILRLSQTSPHS